MKVRLIRSLIAVVALPIVLLSACYANGHVRSYHLQKGFVPAELELNGFFSYWSATDGAFWKACGAAVFGLSDDTLKDIEQQGLAFFDGMTTSRNGEKYLGKWQIGKGSWFYHEGRSGVPLGLDCARDHAILVPFPYYDEIRSGLRNSTYYVSSSRRGVFILIPDKGLLVFSHDD